MNYKAQFNAVGSIFAVPCELADKYLRLASGAAVKALLFILRHNGESVSEEELVRVSGLEKEDLRDALAIFLEAGLIVPGDSCAAPVAAPIEKKSFETETPVTVPPAITHAPFSGNVKPTGANIERLVKEKPELQKFLHEAEAICGKTFTSSDTATIIYLCDHAGMDCCVLMMVMSYCKQLGKCNLRYIEKVALSWLDIGIDSHEKADAYLKKQSKAGKQQKQVKDIFGIHDRNLTAKEAGFIDVWCNEYQFRPEMLKLAYEKTAENIGKVSFAYTNKILTAWHEKKIKTPEQALASDKSQERFSGAPSIDGGALEEAAFRSKPKLKR